MTSSPTSTILGTPRKPPVTYPTLIFLHQVRPPVVLHFVFYLYQNKLRDLVPTGPLKSCIRYMHFYYPRCTVSNSHIWALAFKQQK